MTDPLGDAVRETFRERLTEPVPPLDLPSILRVSRRRSTRRRTVAALAAAASLAMVGGIGAEVVHRDRQQLAEESLDARSLSQKVLDAIGPGASEVAPPVPLASGPLPGAEYGSLAMGRSRLEGAVVDLREVRPDGTVWILLLTVQTLEPHLDQQSLRQFGGLSETQSGLRDVDGSSGSLTVVATDRGVDGVGSLSGGRVMTVNITSGSGSTPQREAMADRAVALFRALEP